MQELLERWGKCTVLLTGASGGVGRVFADTFKQHKNIRLICISSKPTQDKNFLQCDLVKHHLEINEKIDYFIHCACTYNRNKDNVMNKHLVEFAKQKKVKLFVYFSSWVIHSNTFYTDNYTRLKRDAEKLIKQNGINYLILRPSLILGGQLVWDRMLSYLKYFQNSIPTNILFNPINVQDVVQLTLKCMSEEGLHQQCYDLGTQPTSLKDYVINQNHQWHSPNIALGCFQKLFKFSFYVLGHIFIHVSSMGFIFQDYKNFKPQIIKDDLGIDAYVPIYLYENFDGAIFPNSLDELNFAVDMYPQKEIRGRQGIDVLQHKKSTHYISLERLNRLIDISDKTITVEAGATLKDICEYLKRKGRTLAYLPEYLFISIGSCFKTPVHGSSCRFDSILDLVVEHKFFESLTKQKIITEVTITHVPIYYSHKKITFISDSILQNACKLEEQFINNETCYLQWYMKHKQVMIININKVEKKPCKIKRNLLKYRHGNLNFFIHKFLLPRNYYDIAYKLLAPISRDFSRGLGRLFIKYNGYFDVEIKILHKDVNKVISFVRKYQHIIYACGIRCSGKEYYWLDIIIKKHRLNLLSELKDIAEFHTGKVIPKSFGFN